mgnify:CR=1 FL=1
MEQTTGNLSDIVLQCNDISKEFDSFDNSGKNQVLSHIDLSVKKNEFWYFSALANVEKPLC